MRRLALLLIGASGRDTYLRYCASCHGPEGRGDGPLAGSLTPPPADLTQLAKRNGGQYDERAVMATIDGRRQVAAHGARDMPVWGAIFEEEGRSEPYPAYHSLLQSRLLVDYLATIQER
jgi:mono/diheme cytochrome c family protein